VWNITYKETIRLITKSAFSASDTRSVGIRMPGSSPRLPSYWVARFSFLRAQRFPATRCLSASFSVPLPSLLFFLHWCFFFVCVTSQVSVFCFLFCGSLWVGCAIVQAMGASFNLRAGCQKWKSLDPLGTQLPSSDTVVNLCFIFLLGCLCCVISSQQKNTPSWC